MASSTSTSFLLQFTNSQRGTLSVSTQSYPMSFNAELKEFERDSSEEL